MNKISYFDRYHLPLCHTILKILVSPFVTAMSGSTQNFEVDIKIDDPILRYLGANMNFIKQDLKYRGLSVHGCILGRIYLF